MGEEHDGDLAAVETQSTESSTVGTVGFSEDEVNGFLGAVFITDSSDERSALVSAKGKRVDGTCLWMLKTDAYNTWMNTPCPGLWITGGPGMGKSMMSIFLTEHLEMKALNSATESVLYFFCDGQRDMRNNARGILRGLISQLVGLKPSLARHGILEEKSDWGVKTYDVRVESLCRTFNSMVEDPDAGCVFCVIDGLDECDNTSGELINSLLGVKTSRFKPVVVSRPLSPSLTSSLAKYVRLRLETHAEKEVKADLNAFIQQRVQQLSDDGGYPPALLKVLQDTFVKRSEGTFLWVELAAQELGIRPLADVETCLNSLPSGLSGIYSRILESIDPAHVRPVSRLLYVVTTAYNPMGIEDVESLLSIQPTAHLTAFEVTESLVAQCGRLLTIMDHPMFGKRVIQLVHQSVKDYLFRPSSDSGQGLEAFRFQQRNAHLQLASFCLDILESLKIPKERPEDIRNFQQTGSRVQRYAIDCFEDHAKDSGGDFSKLVRRSLPFLQPLAYAYELAGWHHSIHIASQLGVAPIVKHILGYKPLGLYRSIQKYIFLGTTALHHAAMREHSEVVRVLLQKQRTLPLKWSVSSRDCAGNTPLHAAAIRRSVSSVQALLDYKADPNLTNNYGHTPLHRAVCTDHLEVVRLLVSAGARVSTQDLCGRTPLFLAAETGLGHGAHNDGFCALDTDSVMEHLLKAGCDVNRGDQYGILPLHIAVRRNSARDTRLLLQWGANSDLANHWGFKPLHYIAGDREVFTVAENRAFEREGNIWASSMVTFLHNADYQISVSLPIQA